MQARATSFMNPTTPDMFYRRAVEDLVSWYNRENRKPLVIRGARQVGKTTTVRLAAEQLSVPLVEVNLERHTDLDPLFRAANAFQQIRRQCKCN